MDKTIKNLDKSQLIQFQEIFNKELIRTAFINGIECNYLRTPEFRYWNSHERLKIEEKKNQFNSRVIGIKMQITHWEDYEVDYDGDRSYPASFTFTIEKI